MPVVTRYFAVMVPQGMSTIKFDSKDRGACRITVPPPAPSKWLRIGAVAAAMVLITVGVTGCSHSDSTPSANASPTPTDSASPTPAPVAQETPNAQPTPTPAPVAQETPNPRPTHAQEPPTAPFVGTWVNQNAATAGVTRLAIAREGSGLSVHLWTKCGRNTCDGGSHPGEMRGSNLVVASRDLKIGDVKGVVTFDFRVEGSLLAMAYTQAISGGKSMTTREAFRRL